MNVSKPQSQTIEKPETIANEGEQILSEIIQAWTDNKRKDFERLSEQGGREVYNFIVEKHRNFSSQFGIILSDMIFHKRFDRDVFIDTLNKKFNGIVMRKTQEDHIDAQLHYIVNYNIKHKHIDISQKKHFKKDLMDQILKQRKEIEKYHDEVKEKEEKSKEEQLEVTKNHLLELVKQGNLLPPN